MKIAIVTDLPGWSDETMYLQQLKERLNSRDMHIELFTVYCSWAFKKVDTTTGIGRMIEASKLIEKLSNFELVHAQFTFPLGFALSVQKYLKRLKKPLLIHTHGYDVYTVPSVDYGIRRNFVGRKMCTFAWKNSEKVLCVCEDAKQKIIGSGIRSDDVEVISNCVDDALFKRVGFSQLPEALQQLRRRSDFIALMVGSIVPVKNQRLASWAFSEFVKRANAKNSLLIIVGHRPTHSSVTIEGSENVICLGGISHSELVNYYSLADVFLLPSLSEAHPWSLLEAMACECPIIASNVGGIPETVVQKRYLFNPTNPSEIVDKLLEFHSLKKKDVESLRTECRQRILSKFTFQHHIDRLMEIYENFDRR